MFTNLVPEVQRICRLTMPDEFQPVLCGGNKDPRLQWANGSKTHLRSAEHPGGYEGMNVSAVAGDELRLWKREAYQIAIGRVRVKAPMNQRAFTSTPRLNWMAEEFNANKVMHETIKCGTIENARNLDPLYIPSLEAAYSSRTLRALRDGEFTILEGAVFETFDPNPLTSPWIIDWEPTPERLRQCRVYLAVDPGYRRSAWLWIAEIPRVDGKHDWVVFDQMMAENTDDVSCVNFVNARKWPIDQIWFDPAGGNVQSVEGLDPLVALRQVVTRPGFMPLRTLTHYRDIAFGIDKLRVMLGDPSQLKPISLKFARRLVALEKSQPRGIIKDLGGSCYPEMKDGRAITDEPTKDGTTDHSRDALRYWAVGMWMTHEYLRARDKELSRDKRPGYKAIS
jgi:hypothetical protein